VLSHDVVSHHSTPISAADVLGHQCTLESSVLPHLSTMPDLYLRLTSSNRGKQQTRSALDHYHKWFGRHAGAGVQHAKPVTTRLPKFDIGGEPPRLIGLGG
jgi:hypothetical protein